MHTRLHTFLFALMMLTVMHSGYSQQYLACRIYYYYGSDSLNLHRYQSITNNESGQIISKSSYIPDSTVQKIPKGKRSGQWYSSTFYYYEDTLLKREHFFTKLRQTETLYEYDNRNLVVTKKHFKHDDAITVRFHRENGLLQPKKDSLYLDYSLTYSYNDHNQVVSVDYAYRSLANVPFRHFIYTWEYDSLGRVIKHEGRDSDGELMIKDVYTYFDKGYKVTAHLYTYDFDSPIRDIDSLPIKERKLSKCILLDDQGNPVTKIRLNKDDEPIRLTYFIYDSKNRLLKEIICDDGKVHIPKKTFLYHYDE